MKLCKNCKYQIMDLPFDHYFSECKRKIIRVDPVTGSTSYPRCSSERENKGENSCGIDAKFFEKKQSVVEYILGFFKVKVKVS